MLYLIAERCTWSLSEALLNGMIPEDRFRLTSHAESIKVLEALITFSFKS